MLREYTLTGNVTLTILVTYCFTILVTMGLETLESGCNMGLRSLARLLHVYRGHQPTFKGQP